MRCHPPLPAQLPKPLGGRGVAQACRPPRRDAKLDDALAIEVGEEPLDANQETEFAIKGYRDAMTYVLQLAEEPRFHFGEQLLKSLHFMMTSYDVKLRPGRWRAGSIYVHSDQTGAIVYEGPDVELIDSLMHDLVCELQKVSETPILVRAAMAHLNLVMVHPFRDGNGRMARCLQTLVLARDGILPPGLLQHRGVPGTEHAGVLRRTSSGRPGLLAASKRCTTLGALCPHGSPASGEDDVAADKGDRAPVRGA